MIKEHPLCPHCDEPMVRRINTSTRLPFWGCKDYPDCFGTREFDEGEVGYDRHAELPSDRIKGRDQRRWRDES